MSNKTVNIIAFDIPYPPDYGGVIDAFYKLKALHKLGISIILHMYTYDRKKQEKLNNLCSETYYYQRNYSVLDIFSCTPFIVKTRKNKTLLNRLLQNNYPIIFEGLHTTSVLSDKIAHRSFVRTHNIEHIFYNGLMKSESNIFRKFYFKLESLKLKNYEKILKKVNGIFTISPNDQSYFSNNYGEKSAYIPVFHPTNTVEHVPDKNNLVLFHGNLKVSDNKKSALFLIETYKETEFKLLIASSFYDNEIISSIKKHKNISFENIPSQEDLNKLFEKAHINILYTFIKAGIKLKLLNALYKGKFVITNTKMIEKTGLAELCKVANSKQEILTLSREILHQNYDESTILNRKKILGKFNPTTSAEKIIDIIF